MSTSLSRCVSSILSTSSNAQPQVNAFCLPNKEVFVYTGLLDLLPEDDHILAAVIGHEVAHVLQRHGVENMGVS